MIPAEYYQSIYLIIVTVLTFITCYKKRVVKNDFKSAIILCIFMIIFIGYRPINGHVFVDMGNYALLFGRFSWKGFNLNTDNLIFDNLFLFLGHTSLGVTFFFVLIAAIYFGCMLIACKKLFPNNTYIAFLVYLAAFSTFSYGTNGIKAGAAASIFLVALAYGKNYKISIPLALISWGFHHSMQLPVAAYIVSILFKKTNWYYCFWVICFVISALHITFFQTMFAGWTDDHGAKYLGDIYGNYTYRTGFRLDFVIYSIFPIIMGYIATKKYYFVDKTYNILLRTYTLTNAVWLLCMYASFTNRIAYLSWCMYPIVLIYPCLKRQEYNQPLIEHRNLIIGLQLAFTLFMFFIYY